MLIRHACTAAAAGLLATMAAAQGTPQPQYGIREDEPRLGSMIRRYLVRSPTIPINLSYEQLSPADRALFNRNYEAMPEGDEPPFPLGGLRVLLEPLVQAQGILMVSGSLTLLARVDREGKVQEVTALGSPDPRMTRFAASLLVLTRFKPAVCGGQPCAGEFPLRKVFVLE